MEAKANYTQVGLAVVLLTAGLITLSLWLSVGFHQKKYNTYAVYMREAVSGLNEDSAVKFNGVQVGSVKKIELNDHDPRQVQILLAIEEGTPITNSTTATLISQGITGTTYVGLSASSAALTPIKQFPDEPYPVIPSRPSLFNQLDKALKDVSENINSVSVEIKQIFDKDNVQALKITLNNLRTLTTALAQDKQAIHQVVQNWTIFSKNLAKASETFPDTARALHREMKQLSLMVKSITQASLQTGNTMNAGKTALDKITQQTLPPAIAFMNRLNVIAADLEQVSNQLRQNPSVMIRGTTPSRLGPGE